MNEKTWKSIGLCLFFACFSCVLGPYSLSCVSGALLVALFSGAMQAPGFAFVSGALYLVIGLFAPVLPDWNHGMTSGFGPLFSGAGGMLLALPLTAFVVSLLQRLIKKPYLNLLAGLGAGFIAFFGSGLLWFVIRSGAPDLRSIGTALLLYLFDAMVVFAARFLQIRFGKRHAK